MRDRWLIMGAAVGAALLLPNAGSAQTMAVPPSWAPSLAQSPTMPPPDQLTPAPTVAPANPSAAPASPATETKPAAKLKMRATAQTRKAKTAKAKPPETMAPIAQTAAPAASAAEATAAEPRRTGKHRAAGSAARTPRDIVAAIYKVAAGKDASYDGPSAFDDRRIRKLYFSKGLIAAVAATEKKTAGGSILNFDPITNSEGSDVEDLNIALESEKPDQKSVAARFNSQDNSSIIHYDFVKEGKLWKLDDIRGEIVGQQGQWSLREILKNSAQQS